MMRAHTETILYSENWRNYQNYRKQWTNISWGRYIPKGSTSYQKIQTAKKKCKAMKIYLFDLWNCKMFSPKMNEHHQVLHPPVLCDICGKECSTPLSLEWHRYSHKETAIPVWYLQSGISVRQWVGGTQNQTSHHQNIYMCSRKVWQKLYEKIGNWQPIQWSIQERTLSASVVTYEMSDKHLYWQHLRKHSEEKCYSCKMCGQRFKHTTQILCHKRDKH